MNAFKQFELAGIGVHKQIKKVVIFRIALLYFERKRKE